MTQAQRALAYLWSVEPDGAPNADLAHYLGTSHQTVYMLTQDLLRKGLIRGESQGRTWRFHLVDSLREPVASAFEVLARDRLCAVYGVRLAPGFLSGERHAFALVSPDGQTVGDILYLLLSGAGTPTALFAAISERVWLLTRTGAPRTFLVFGGDRAIPLLWLARHGHLIADIAFFYLAATGDLECLGRQEDKAPAPLSKPPLVMDLES